MSDTQATPPLPALTREERDRIRDFVAMMHKVEGHYSAPRLLQAERRKTDLDRVVLDLERRAGALYDFFRADEDTGRRARRRSPGVFSGLSGGSFLVSEDEMVQHAVVWCEHCLHGESPPLDAFGGAVRHLVRCGLAINEQTREAETQWNEYVQASLPSPGKRGQKRGRESAMRTVARLLGREIKWVRAAVKRAEKTAGGLHRREGHGSVARIARHRAGASHEIGDPSYAK